MAILTSILVPDIGYHESGFCGSSQSLQSVRYVNILLEPYNADSRKEIIKLPYEPMFVPCSEHEWSMLSPSTLHYEPWERSVVIMACRG